MSIAFSDIQFSEPLPLFAWQPQARPGLYAILIPEPKATPKPFRPVYFGQTSDFSDRDIGISHHKYSCWLRQAISTGNLYISVYLMPGVSEQQRRAVEAKLIQDYKPFCND